MGGILENRQGALHAGEVAEVVGQVMPVRVGVLFEDGDSIPGASGAGQESGDVRRHVRGCTCGAGAGCGAGLIAAANVRQMFSVAAPRISASRAPKSLVMGPLPLSFKHLPSYEPPLTPDFLLQPCRYDVPLAVVWPTPGSVASRVLRPSAALPDRSRGNDAANLMYTRTMKAREAFCMRCGSADTRLTHFDQNSAEGTCFRRDKPFHATPCQECGGFRIDGSFGVPGACFENLPETVKCRDCGHRNPLRDPGPE